MRLPFISFKTCKLYLDFVVCDVSPGTRDSPSLDLIQESSLNFATAGETMRTACIGQQAIAFIYSGVVVLYVYSSWLCILLIVHLLLIMEAHRSERVAPGKAVLKILHGEMFMVILLPLLISHQVSFVMSGGWQSWQRQTQASSQLSCTHAASNGTLDLPESWDRRIQTHAAEIEWRAYSLCLDRQPWLQWRAEERFIEQWEAEFSESGKPNRRYCSNPGLKIICYLSGSANAI